MFFVYILKSDYNASYYVGSCNDVEKRLKQHNALLNRSTKRYAPWSLVYFERYDDLKTARKRELQIKMWKKRSAIEKLFSKGP